MPERADSSCGREVCRSFLSVWRGNCADALADYRLSPKETYDDCRLTGGTTEP